MHDLITALKNIGYSYSTDTTDRQSAVYNFICS